MTVLLSIPKNLVYVFVCVIVFAFAGMLYITYTEQNMTEFLTYDRTQEVVMVHPLFQQLRESMNLDTELIEEVASKNVTVKSFNTKYLTANRPVIIKGMAKEWKATAKWGDKDYLIEKVGQSTCR